MKCVVQGKSRKGGAPSTRALIDEKNVGAGIRSKWTNHVARSQSWHRPHVKEQHALIFYSCMYIVIETS